MAPLISDFVFALLLPKSEILIMKPSSMSVQPGLCLTWSETSKTYFLTMQLIYGSPKREVRLIRANSKLSFYQP